jgi:hypothetical protein
VIRKILSIAAIATAAIVAGCANYDPIPKGYTGPTAQVVDTATQEDSHKAQIFAVLEIDGHPVNNAFIETEKASHNKGLTLLARSWGRSVPVKPMQLKIRASHTTGAPIHEIFSRAAGTFYSVEGVVDFTPVEAHDYIVKGNLAKDGSAVWIEDMATGEAVTKKVF